MRITLVHDDSMSGHDTEALDGLDATKDPDELAAAPLAATTVWDGNDEHVLVWADDGALAAHVGIVVREVTVDGVTAVIGGIGGVRAHPDYRGERFATRGLEYAQTRLLDEHAVRFSELFCMDALVPFYARLGWRVFPGTVYVSQREGRIPFVAMNTMLLPGREPTPAGGVLDLLGPPW